MDILDLYWIDFVGLAIGIVCVNGAITGRFYTHSRGHRKRLLAEVRSSWVRLMFLFVGGAIFALVTRDLVHKLSGAGLR